MVEVLGGLLSTLDHFLKHSGTVETKLFSGFFVGFFLNFPSGSFRSLDQCIWQFAYSKCAVVSCICGEFKLFLDMKWSRTHKTVFLQFLCAFVGFLLSKFTLMLYLLWVLAFPVPSFFYIICAVLPISLHHNPGWEHCYYQGPVLWYYSCLLLRWGILQWCGLKLQIWISQPVALAWLFIVHN